MNYTRTQWMRLQSEINPDILFPSRKSYKKKKEKDRRHSKLVKAQKKHMRNLV